MKKVFFAIAIAVLFGMGLSSCTQEGGKCYKVTYTASLAGTGTEVTVYEWLTEEQVATQKAKYEAEGYTNIVFTEMTQYSNATTCIALGNTSELID